MLTIFPISEIKFLVKICGRVPGVEDLGFMMATFLPSGEINAIEAL
ncbi:hypothetical protein [Shewanella woodyi]